MPTASADPGGTTACLRPPCPACPACPAPLWATWCVGTCQARAVRWRFLTSGATVKKAQFVEFGSSRMGLWFIYGYGSIPIDTIFSGMNIHLPAILGFTRYQGFDPSPYIYMYVCGMIFQVSNGEWVCQWWMGSEWWAELGPLGIQLELPKKVVLGKHDSWVNTSEKNDF